MKDHQILSEAEFVSTLATSLSLPSIKKDRQAILLRRMVDRIVEHLAANSAPLAIQTVVNERPDPLRAGVEISIAAQILPMDEVMHILYRWLPHFERKHRMSLEDAIGGRIVSYTELSAADIALCQMYEALRPFLKRMKKYERSNYI